MRFGDGSCCAAQLKMQDGFAVGKGVGGLGLVFGEGDVVLRRGGRADRRGKHGESWWWSIEESEEAGA